MNVTKLKKEEVFRERTDIDEFDVIDLCKLDAQMLKRIEESPIVHFKDADKYILSCFNNAYYIAILILNDKHPVHHVKRYIEIAESAAPHVDDNGYVLYEYRYIECMTMAMVFNYLRACDQDLYGVKENSPLLKAIRDYHADSHNFRPPVHNATVLFFDNILSPQSVTENMVNKELFYPKLPLEEIPAEADNSELMDRIKELEEENEHLKRVIEGYETQGKGISAPKNALLLTTLCHHLGGLPQNGRQALSPVLQTLCGYTEKTSEDALKRGFKDKDVESLAKVFHATSPKVESEIKKMPETLKEIDNQRLRKYNEVRNVKEN